MSQRDGTPDVSGNISVGGNFSGAAAIGSDIRQEVHLAALTDAETADLRREVDHLRAALLKEAPPDLREEASQRADELAEAVLTDRPDLSKLERLRDWIGERMPQLASAFTTLVLHPVLGKLVAAGGDGLVGALRRLGG